MKPILKSRKLYQCTCDEEGEIVDRQLVDISYFNEDGRIVKQEGYQDGELATLIENEFENGNLVRVRQLDYIFETEQNFENNFDEKNRPVEQIEHFQGGGFSKTKFEYDENGKLLKQYSEDEEGTIEHLIENIFDEKGNVVEVREFDAEDLTTPWITKTYEYDEKGNILSFTEAYRDQEATTREYTYDENGEMLTVEMFYTEDEDLIMEQKNTLDEKGQVISRAMFHHKENMKREEISTYNSKGQVIQTETLINDNFHSLHKEELNRYGDLVLQKELQPLRGGNGYMQWSATVSELEYWENTIPQNEEEE